MQRRRGTLRENQFKQKPAGSVLLSRECATPRQLVSEFIRADYKTRTKWPETARIEISASPTKRSVGGHEVVGIQGRAPRAGAAQEQNNLGHRRRPQAGSSRQAWLAG